MRKIDTEYERKFENLKVSDDNVRAPQAKFYKLVRRDIALHQEFVARQIVGLRILEIGCSAGGDALFYASKAASYDGIDISDHAIQVAQNKGIKNANFVSGDAHSLPYDDGVFDCIIVNSLLHHLNLEKIVPEMKRVSVRDGILLFREPLGINPIFQMYRYFTPSARTPDERPFNLKDIRYLNENLEFLETSYFGFFTLLTAVPLMKIVAPLFLRLDEALSKTKCRLLFWQISGKAKFK